MSTDTLSKVIQPEQTPPYKPTVGEKLYLDGDRWCPPGECEVVKVGRKYFTVKLPDSNREYVFKIADWRENTEYGSRNQLYQNEQAYLDKCELTAWKREFRKAFGSVWDTNGTLDQYRAAGAIFGMEVKDMIDMEENQ